MDMTCPVHGHKECVVVGELPTTIDMGEESYKLPLAVFALVQKVGWDKVEIAGIEIELFVELLNRQPIMTELGRKSANMNK